MFRFVNHQDMTAKAALTEAGGRRVTVELAPDDGWIERLQHDVAGALRSFRYLARKARASYDPGDARGQKVIDSIDRHLATMENLKQALLDPLLATTSPSTAPACTPEPDEDAD